MSEFRVLIGPDWAGVRAIVMEGIMALRMEHGAVEEVLLAFAKLALAGFDGAEDDRSQMARLIATRAGFTPIQLAAVVRMIEATGRAPEPTAARQTMDRWTEYVFEAEAVAEWARAEMRAGAQRAVEEAADEFGPELLRLRQQAEVEMARRAGKVH